MNLQSELIYKSEMESVENRQKKPRISISRKMMRKNENFLRAMEAVWFLFKLSDEKGSEKIETIYFISDQSEIEFKYQTVTSTAIRTKSSSVTF